MNFLCNEYWLIRGRPNIKSLLQQCVTCKYTNAKAVTPPATSASPKFRLDYSFSCQNIGLDYAGPIYFKICYHAKKKKKKKNKKKYKKKKKKKKKKKMVKGFFLIITCCCTLAVHIELTPGLSLKSFLLASRRCGITENIISDNLKTFKTVEVHNFLRFLRIK